MSAAPGKRGRLIEILIEGTAEMPGCLSYVIARDADDEAALWISEVWERKEAHEASLSLPSVQKAIASGRSMIAEMGERIETEPVGGHGLVRE